MNGLIVMRGRENVWAKDTPRKEVGQWRKCGQGRRKETEFIKVMLFSKESPSLGSSKETGAQLFRSATY